ncbi:tetratricopeptide repeat protein [Lyngbya confervoides]|uniref:Tetratricopeptide repeat protein n=1 Tax=Lyngbya confervoides BDU141951 TaxID=1574623 RepID=A0ABD4T0R8_9CYAN|nr:tetratricopeptide repeat protein [Lyngbya confervoides]MCM1982371.1 tetratricopeptide repeat protein [Lyngbya confervoides BDU141951]
MATSRRFYWVVGTASLLGGLVYLGFATGLVTPAGPTVQTSASSSVREQRALSLHTSGIRKALQGDYQGAIADYSQAIELSPQNPEIYYNRGVAYYSVGNSPSAIADFNQTLQLDPAKAQAYANRGAIFLESGNSQAALADAQTAAQLFEAQGDPRLADQMQDWIQQQGLQAD